MFAPKDRLITLVLCVTLAFVSSEGCNQNRDLFYAALTDADKAEEVNRGWIPDYLPKSSRAIHIIEQLSPSREWCAFEFLPSDSQGLRGALKNIATLPQSAGRVPSPGASWWPAMLKGNLDPQRIHKEGLNYTSSKRRRILSPLG
jgi:hypothetical protein